MANPILPVLIEGPAIIDFDGYSFYFKGGIQEELDRESFNIDSDIGGDQIDTRHKSTLTLLSGTPVGEIESLAKYFPFGPADIGKSIFGAADKPLVIRTKFGGAAGTGQTITYARGAIIKTPPLRLRPSETLFGEMQFACLGVKTVQQNTANYLRTIADSAFADTGFDETKVVTDIYRAAFGAAPYDAMGSMNGFELNLQMETERIPADDVGIAGITLKALVGTASFIPSNLTQAQIDTLLMTQDATVVFPGQSYSKNNTDLIITGSGNNGLTLTATLSKAGPQRASAEYGIAKHRHKALMFTSKRTWTAGVANPLWTLAVA